MSNALAAATSPYLRQHAENPVHWQEWGQSAFDEARHRGVPIFLSVGYASCHWCHVMAHESFEDTGVAQVLNENFVSVKVDREERPDVDAIYMGAAQAMTGHGGWPMTALLLPDGRPFHAGTYYPREQLLMLLEETLAAWNHHRADAERFADQLTAALQQGLGVPGGAGAPGAPSTSADASDPAAAGASTFPGRPILRPEGDGLPISPAMLDSTVGTLAREFDREHPGFGQAPKFPPSASLVHLTRLGRRSGSQHASAMAQQIGDAMARGGIHDQLGGGFARYAVDRAWVVPHFEKMLYDNAQLLRAYTELFTESGQPIFERAVRGIVAFLERDLSTGEGALASALDADTQVDGQGVEGATYVWTPAQLNEALGLRGGTLAAEVFHVHVGGTFERGTSVLQLPREPREVVARIRDKHADAPLPPAAIEDADAWFAQVRERLLHVRGGRSQPGRDDKVVTSWNALAVAALAQAGQVFAEPAWIEWAQRIARFLLEHHRSEGRWRRASIGGVAGLADATADDLGNLAEGLVALAEVTGQATWREEARAVLHLALSDYAVDPASPGAGGFFDVPAVPADGVELLVRPRSLVDLAEPCGTSALAGALARFASGAPAGDADGETFTQAAHRAIGAMAQHALTTPRFAGWALATAELLAAQGARA